MTTLGSWRPVLTPPSAIVGVAAALLAALAWSMNFIVPFAVGDYSIFDIALLRFAISGICGLVFLGMKRKATSRLKTGDWLMAIALGLIGYLGYFLMVAGAAIYAGPVIAPAFLGLVPVVLAIAGNLRARMVPWRNLMLPLFLATTGLALIHINIVSQPRTSNGRSLMVGIPLAIAAVSLWTWFGILNQNALAKRRDVRASTWTALIMVGAGLGILVFLPIGLAVGVFEIPRLGLRWDIAGPLVIWGTSLALFGSIGGALAWTFASQRIPVALSGQLISAETVFGTIFGLLVHHRWPTLPEAVGMMTLIIGAVTAVRIFQRSCNQRAD